MSTSIYFIAVLPKQEIQDEITAFKEYAAKKFNTKRALTSPPHITIVAPFKFEDNDILHIKQEISDFTKDQDPFEIELKDFNCFAPRVIYVDVMKSEELNRIYTGFNTILENKHGVDFKYKEQEFHPHMTVAFKDLKENMFPKAWKYFRKAKYKQTFSANALTLLKHNGKEWDIMEVFPFVA